MKNSSMHKHFDKHYIEHNSMHPYTVTSGCFTMELSFEQIKALYEWAEEHNNKKYNEVRVEDLEIGMELYQASVVSNGKLLDIRKYITIGDVNSSPIPVLCYPITESFKPYKSKLFLSDAGIIPNDYNQHKTFRTLEEAEKYASKFK